MTAMTSPSTSPSRVAAGPNPYRLLVIGFGVMIAVSAVTAIVLNLVKRDGIKDYPKWYDAGQRMLHHGDLYTTGKGETFEFMYPPSCAALLAPLTVAGEHAMAVALVLLNSAAWVFCVLVGVYLVTGRALRQAPVLYALPVVVTLPYVWATYTLGQPNLLLLACMLGAFLCLRGQAVGAGALVAVAAAVKAFPIAAVVYLVYRRYWVAAVSTVLSVAFLLLLLPVPMRGPVAEPPGRRHLGRRDALPLRRRGDRPAAHPRVQLEEPVDGRRRPPPAAAGGRGHVQEGRVVRERRRPLVQGGHARSSWPWRWCSASLTSGRCPAARAARRGRTTSSGRCSCC